MSGASLKYFPLEKLKRYKLAASLPRGNLRVAQLHIGARAGSSSIVPVLIPPAWDEAARHHAHRIYIHILLL
ncbi:MAG: hypothetical protein JJU27_17485 [Gammaproteobacteria bacterium]|nr:hypothetical protein [Gammaproteobacteria bacterium]MCC5870297.1 hypothetical protein [Gammaproteobacteria bacterium]